jgi:hypothetical protein
MKITVHAVGAPRTKCRFCWNLQYRSNDFFFVRCLANQERSSEKQSIGNIVRVSRIWESTYIGFAPTFNTCVYYHGSSKILDIFLQDQPSTLFLQARRFADHLFTWDQRDSHKGLSCNVMFQWGVAYTPLRRPCFPLEHLLLRSWGYLNAVKAWLLSYGWIRIEYMVCIVYMDVISLQPIGNYGGWDGDI